MPLYIGATSPDFGGDGRILTLTDRVQTGHAHINTTPPHWGGRGELNAQENRVTVCPNIPVVSTATLVVHCLDEN